MDTLRIAADQLGRMRGMTRLYHERFFADVRASIGVTLALFVIGWWAAGEAFLLIPVVALLGAAMTAFDASYLMFARHYAAKLERDINLSLGRDVLLGSRLEDAYLFPLNTTKIVTASFSPFTWFGFMTLFLTAIGAASYVFGLALGLPVLADHGTAWAAAYLVLLAVFTLAAVFVGWWWFIGGVGERRLAEILEN